MPTALPTTMQAVRPGSTTIEQVAVPPVPEGFVLVEVERCGICGSDLHWYHGAAEPRTVCPGHEIAGIVRGTPPARSGLRDGTRVAIEAIHTCGHCRHCEEGDRQLCAKLEILGLHRPGGFARFVVIHPRHILALPADLGPAAGALVEPLAVAMHAVRIAGGIRDRSALILGAGSLGLLTAYAAREMGAARTTITARHPHQNTAARALGIDAVEPPDGASGDWDFVFETVGGPSTSTLDEALRRVRPGGTVVLSGLFHAPPQFDALALMSREIRLCGANCYGTAAGKSDFQAAADLIARDSDRLVSSLVTHTVALADFGRAMDIAADKSSGSIKVQVAVADAAD